MPVIQTYSPLQAVADVGAGFLGERKAQAEKARDLALQAAKDKQAQANTDREFTERQREYSETHDLDTRRTEAEIAHTQLSDSLAKAVDKRAAELQPLLKAKMVLENKAAAGEIDLRHAQLQGAILDNKIKQATADLAPQMAHAALSKAYADARATNASADNLEANAAATRATVPAEIAEMNARAASYGRASETSGGGFDKHGVLKDVAALHASLSPTGQKFLDMTMQTNNAGSTNDAMSALAQAKLPPKDKLQLMHAFAQPSFRTAFMQTNNQEMGRNERAGNRADLRKRQGGMDTWTALAGSPMGPFAQLQPATQARVKTLILSHGLNVDDLEAGLRNAQQHPEKNATGFSAAEIDQLLAALGT